MAGSTAKNLVLKYFFSKTWGSRRNMPKLAKKSFSQLWKEKHNLH
jgi:L-lactate dehydrogenase complex protein LldF